MHTTPWIAVSKPVSGTPTGHLLCWEQSLWHHCEQQANTTATDPTTDPAGIPVCIDLMASSLALEAGVRFQFRNLQHILPYSQPPTYQCPRCGKSSLQEEDRRQKKKRLPQEDIIWSLCCRGTWSIRTYSSCRKLCHRQVISVSSCSPHIGTFDTRVNESNELYISLKAKHNPQTLTLIQNL